MSHYAQGWGQRQQLGDPIAKAVLQALCYLITDENLRVWPKISTLCTYTEFEDRAVRKALQRLADTGWLLDTGKRVNNIVVWRIPRYERWLAAQGESTPALGRALDSEALADVQADDSPQEKTDETVSDNKSPRKGEGFEQVLPSTRQVLPSTSSSTPVDGRESSLDLPLSLKPARAMRLEDWKAQARVLTERAPNKAVKETPGILLKGHYRFWRKMADWYGLLWLKQTGEWPQAEWTRVLNLWNHFGDWRELDELLKAMTLDRPQKPPMLGEIEDLFRKQGVAKKPRYDEAASRAVWKVQIDNQAIALAPHYGVGKYAARTFADLEHMARARIEAKCKELLDRIIAAEKSADPPARRVLEATVNDELVAELKLFRPAPAPTKFEEPVFSE